MTPELIVETDVFSDVDDLGALAVIGSLVAAGRARLLSVGVNTPSRWGPIAVQALLEELGCEAPVGDLGYRDDSVYEYDFAHFIAETFAPAAAAGGVDREPAWRLHRRSLAGAAEQAVTVISLGFFDNLIALLNSPADDISPLTGAELVRNRVRRLVVMGGAFPSGTEFNLARSPQLSRELLHDWPGEIHFLGYEVGASVITGRQVSRDSSSIVGSAYRHFTGPGAGRESWDPLTVLFAVPPLSRKSPLFRLSEPGEVLVSETGVDSFHPRPDGRHRYAIPLVGDDALERAVDRHLT